MMVTTTYRAIHMYPPLHVQTIPIGCTWSASDRGVFVYQQCVIENNHQVQEG